MQNSKIIRLNKACNDYIENIRDIWLDGFKDSKLQPSKDFFSDIFIIRLALSHYFNYLVNDKGEF